MYVMNEEAASVDLQLLLGGLVWSGMSCTVDLLWKNKEDRYESVMAQCFMCYMGGNEDGYGCE